MINEKDNDNQVIAVTPMETSASQPPTQTKRRGRSSNGNADDNRSENKKIKTNVIQENMYLKSQLVHHERIITDLVTKVEDLTNIVQGLKSLTNTVQELKTKVEGSANVNIGNILDTDGNVGSFSFSDLFKSKPDSKPDEFTSELLNVVAIEEKNKANRDSNLMVSGVVKLTSESPDECVKHDDLKVKEIFNHLKLDSSKILKTTRIGDKPLLKIQLKDNESQIKILKVANKGLRTSSKFDNIYINKDLTPAQRISEKNRRNERNKLNSGRTVKETKLFYYGIRDGIIKKIMIKSSEKASTVISTGSTNQTVDQTVDQIGN